MPAFYFIISSHLLVSLISSARVSYFLSKIDLLFVASVDASTSFSLSSISNHGGFEDCSCIRIDRFVNRFIHFNLRWWQKMSYFSSFLVSLSCFYRVFFKFRHLARVFSKSNECFRLDWHFSSRFSTQIVKYLLKRNVLASPPRVWNSSKRHKILVRSPGSCISYQVQ